MFEHLKKVQLERAHRAAVSREQNKREWYKQNPWALSAREMDWCDEDYSGRGLEFDFWDAPN